MADHIDRFIASLTEAQQTAIQLLARTEGNTEDLKHWVGSQIGTAPSGQGGRQFLQRYQGAIANVSGKIAAESPIVHKETAPAYAYNPYTHDQSQGMGPQLPTAQERMMAGLRGAWNDRNPLMALQHGGGLLAGKLQQFSAQGFADKGSDLLEAGHEARGKAYQGIGHLMQGLKGGENGVGSLLRGVSKVSEGAQASGALGSVGGGVAGAVGGVAALGAAAYEGMKKVQEWGDSLHKANMQFAEFSGAMAGVEARQEVRDMQLSRERGERRAASAEYLAEGKNGLDKSMAVIEDSVAVLSNYVTGTLARVINIAAEAIADVIKLLPGWGKSDKDQTNEIDADEYLAAAGMEGLMQNYGVGWKDLTDPASGKDTMQEVIRRMQRKT